MAVVCNWTKDVQPLPSWTAENRSASEFGWLGEPIRLQQP